MYEATFKWKHFNGTIEYYGKYLKKVIKDDWIVCKRDYRLIATIDLNNTKWRFVIDRAATMEYEGSLLDGRKDASLIEHLFEKHHKEDYKIAVHPSFLIDELQKQPYGGLRYKGSIPYKEKPRTINKFLQSFARKVIYYELHSYTEPLKSLLLCEWKKELPEIEL